MKRSSSSLRSIACVGPWIAAVTLAACSSNLPTGDDDTLSGGSAGTLNGTGGKTGAGAGGQASAGGTLSAGGSGAIGTGGTGSAGLSGGSASGGSMGTAAGMGGSSGSASTTGGAGGNAGSVAVGSGGALAGGTAGMSGGASGRAAGGASGRATGGTAGTSAGGAGAGGAGSGGTGGSSGTGSAGDPCSTATLPTGGTVHSSASAQGTAAGLSWSIWSNGSGGSITTFDTPAFSTSWNNSSDFLARLGLQWGSGKPYAELGTIAAQFNEKKSGDGGGYSYVGIYGWSNDPCIEWYIVDDSYKTMPVNPGNTTNKGTVTIDGGDYILYTRPTSGTGGSRCSGVSDWTQFYSVRKTARTCGQITISDHFDAWAAAGMALGNVLEASMLVEVGGGVGSVELPVANITTTM